MHGGPITLAILGAGNRGRHTYARYALDHPDEARIVAVADPDAGRREALAAEHGATAHASWRALLAGPAPDLVVVATPDREHVAPTLAALERSLDVLLEKPIAPTEPEVRAVLAAAERSTGSVTIAHVLRYTPFFGTLKRLLDEGRIGQLVTVHHAENIGWWHFAHSFVRGNWRREDLAAPMLLAKACHDLDILRWLAGAPCERVASFGGLTHFRIEQAPPGSVDRCTDGCPVAAECPFEAVRFYVDRTADTDGWPVSVITDDPTPAGRLGALQTGPYGRCVYRCDNDVADHQVATLEFANGVRATLAVNALTADNTRSIKLVGTRGEIRGRLDTGEIELRSFFPAGPLPPDGPWDVDERGRGALRGDERELITAAPPAQDGHGGGDAAMLRDLLTRVRARRDGRTAPTTPALTDLATSAESHLMAFAAERSRHERRMVDL